MALYTCQFGHGVMANPTRYAQLYAILISANSKTSPQVLQRVVRLTDVNGDGKLWPSPASSKAKQSVGSVWPRSLMSLFL